MRILGLDLGLGCTGVCRDGETEALKLRGTGATRLDTAYTIIRPMAMVVDLVAFEGYAMGNTNHQSFAIGELGGVARLAVRHAGTEILVIAPASLKRYATGRGNANKTQMVSAAVVRAGHGFETDDEADAWWLWAFAMDLHGEPVLKMPELNREALEKYRVPA